MLNAIRTAQVNGFSLWDSVTHFGLGREPRGDIPRVMAEKLVSAYSTTWPTQAQEFITAKQLVDALEPAKNHGMTSKRPALLAYVLGHIGDARKGTPQHVLSAAVGAAKAKLVNESIRDTAVALKPLNNEQRRVLHDVAEGKYTFTEMEDISKGSVERFKGKFVGLDPRQLAALILLLTEAGEDRDRVRLQPPYAELLKSWISPNGELAICVDGERKRLDS